MNFFLEVYPPLSAQQSIFYPKYTYAQKVEAHKEIQSKIRKSKARIHEIYERFRQENQIRLFVKKTYNNRIIRQQRKQQQMELQQQGQQQLHQTDNDLQHFNNNLQLIKLIQQNEENRKKDVQMLTDKIRELKNEHENLIQSRIDQPTFQQFQDFENRFQYIENHITALQNQLQQLQLLMIQHGQKDSFNYEENAQQLIQQQEDVNPEEIEEEEQYFNQFQTEIMNQFIFHLLNNNYQIEVFFRKQIPKIFEKKEDYIFMMTGQLISESIQQILTNLLKFQNSKQKKCQDVQISYNYNQQHQKFYQFGIKYKYQDMDLLNQIVLICFKDNKKFRINNLSQDDAILAFVNNNIGFTLKYIETNNKEFYLCPILDIISMIRCYKGIQSFRSQEEKIIKLIMNPYISRNEINIYQKQDIQKDQNLSQKLNQISNRLNQSQLYVIEKVIYQKEGLCLIQGPPGTGKTHTLVELIQLEQEIKQRNKKFLVCTPSNHQLDIIIQKLQTFQSERQNQSSLLRLGETDSRDNQIIEVSINYKLKQNQKEKQKEKEKDKDKDKEKENFQETQIIYSREIKKADIIFSTLNTAGISYLKNFQNHFDILFVDEAAFALEYELLIPLYLKFNKIILIGDQKQLRPLCFYRYAEENLLNRSFYERVIDNQIEPYLLTIQYRMHEEILFVPNLLFYNGLIQTADIDALKLQKNQLIPRQAFINTNFQQDKSKSSFSNYEECDLTLELIKMFSIYEKDLRIGVICAYKGQVKLLKSRLEKNQNSHVEINTIDSFQGSESDIIIFGTQRHQNGLKHLGDVNRLNVAFTRAKKYFYILGSYSLLDDSPIWNQIFKHYREKRMLIELNQIEKIISGAKSMRQ